MTALFSLKSRTFFFTQSQRYYFYCFLWYLLTLITSCDSPYSNTSQNSDKTDKARDVLGLARRFERDPAFRGTALADSLVNKQNSYSRVRLAHYSDSEWGRLPVGAFYTRPIVPSDIGKPPPTPNGSWSVVRSDAMPNTREELVELGRRMFTRYPAQIESSLFPILKDRDALSRYGLWQTDDSVGGLVWAALPGGVYPAFTCSTCHSSVSQSGKLKPGTPNHQFDLGKAKDDYLGTKSLYSGWGPGRLDIAPDGKNNPVVIGDVRAVRFQTHLHRTANIKNSLLALSLRVETGLILAHRKVVRPERRDAFALAYYMWRLGDQFSPQTAMARPGRRIFEAHCSTCHKGSALAGPPVPADSIASPMAEMPSTARGTGNVRTPSLWGVSGRALLLYGGDAKNFDALLDPERKTGGHYQGKHLSNAERTILKEYLRTL